PARRPLLCGVILALVACPGLFESAHSQTSDRDAKFRLAQGLEQAGEYERAAGLYEGLLAGDSSNFVLLDAVQRVWMQLKRYDQVIGLLRGRLARTPSDANLHAMLGSVLYRAGREQDADAEWNAALATNPANGGTYRLVAAVMIENRLLDRAADVYRSGRRGTGDPDLFTLELAQLLASTMNYSGATTEYIRWLARNPTQLSFVQSRLAQMTGREEARAAATAVFREALGDRGDLPLLQLLAWLAMEGKKYDEAFEVYRKIDALANAHGNELYQFAERASGEKAYDVAARAYQEAIGVPLSPSRMPFARYGYAVAVKELRAEADTFASPLRGTPATEAVPLYSGAVRLFQKIIEDYPHTEFSARSWYQIGLMQSEKFLDREGAVASLRHVIDESGGLPSLRNEATLAMGKVHIARGDTAQAGGYFRAVAAAGDALAGERDEASFRLAEIDYFAGRFDSSMQKLSGISVDLKADYANDALRLGAFLQENAGTAPEALKEFARAEFLARQGKNTEAVAVLLSVIASFPQAPLVDDALMAVGQLQASAGLFREAAASYERLLAEFRESSIELDRAEFNLAEVYQYGMHDALKARTTYERLLADHPKSILAGRARQRIRQLRGESL
ncbi:MAG TPA: tetratricopeptide repeat protein, partial [Bacteroidota bacterium]|nr:tetratricopeptide repeat protein [Bacteroidota bacterium]